MRREAPAAGGKPETVTVGGVEGTRYTFTHQERIKETATVRRGRISTSHSHFGQVDEQARRQIRQIVADARWAK